MCYFRRICLQMPTGSVSFERKLLSLEHHPRQSFLSYPYADFWTNSTIPLCPFQVTIQHMESISKLKFKFHISFFLAYFFVYQHSTIAVVQSSCYLSIMVQVHSSGLIEDQTIDALEVDFANKYLGGGALHRGCVQV